MEDSLKSIDTRNIIRTMLLNGYTLHGFERPAPGARVIVCRKFDKLGAEARIQFLVSDAFPEGLLRRFLSAAQRGMATPIAITTSKEKPTSDIVTYTLEEFYKCLGGAVRADCIFRPDLEYVLDELGHNRLPDEFIGRPDELLESYSEECLEYLIGIPVSRFGQERRFERLPDAVALGRDGLNLLLDTKAYAAGFKAEADDIRRFSDYVRDFDNRYSSHVGRASVFVVISGSFTSDEYGLRERSRDMMISSGVPLLHLKARDLAKAVALVKVVTSRRNAINWRSLLLADTFALERLEAELRRIARDNILP